jgi:hypothetical protein
MYMWKLRIILIFVYLLLYVPLKNFLLMWRCHHCQWRAAKFRPRLGAQGLWAGRDRYHATPAVTRGLGFSGLIQRTALFSRLLRHTRGCELIDYITSRSRIFHLCGDVTITGEGLQNLSLCSALMAFEQGEIFIVPHLLWHGALIFLVSNEGPLESGGWVENLF